LAALFFVSAEGAQSADVDPECVQDPTDIGRQLARLVMIGVLAKLPVTLLLLVIGILHTHKFISREEWTPEERRKQKLKWRIKEWGCFWIPGSCFTCFCILFLTSFVANIHVNDLTKWMISVSSVILQTFVVMPLIKALCMTAFTTYVALSNPGIVQDIVGPSGSATQDLSNYEDNSLPVGGSRVNSADEAGAVLGAHGGVDGSRVNSACSAWSLGREADVAVDENRTHVNIDGEDAGMHLPTRPCEDFEKADNEASLQANTSTATEAEANIDYAKPFCERLLQAVPAGAPSNVMQTFSSDFPARLYNTSECQETNAQQLACINECPEPASKELRPLEMIPARVESTMGEQVIAVLQEPPADMSKEMLPAREGHAMGEQVMPVLEKPPADMISLHFIALRCGDEEMPLQAGVPLRLCLSESTFSVRVRISCAGMRPFFAFQPRLLSTGDLQTENPIFKQLARSTTGGSISPWRDGWLRLRFPRCERSGRDGLRGMISMAVGGACTNLPVAVSHLPFELQCLFDDIDTVM
jgi:hypothetical protein